MDYRVEEDVLSIHLQGRFDAHNADSIEEELNKIIEENSARNVILDCEGLTYIASAGLRVLLKLGKKLENLCIINASPEVYEVLEFTGFTDMFDTKKAMRTISVEGCPEVGAGLSSNVYRLNGDTVVKVYSKRISMERIYSETASAKRSFVAGIPTAIPFDVVKVGDQYGTCYELLNPETLSQRFMDHPEEFDMLMEKYVALLKKFHSTEAAEGSFPKIRTKFENWAKGLSKYLEPEEMEKIYAMIAAVPDRKTMVHADCHSRNIMVQNGELIFVDMADVSVGHPFFDIGTEYFHYIIFRETSYGATLIFGKEPDDEMLPVKVWDALVERYFADVPEEKMGDVRKALKYFGNLRCMILVAKHSQIDSDKAMELIGRGRRELLPYWEEAVELFKRADEFFL